MEQKINNETKFGFPFVVTHRTTIVFFHFNYVHDWNFFSLSIIHESLGLLSSIDDEWTFPNGTDLTFANKLKEHLNSNSCFGGERGKVLDAKSYYRPTP